MAVAKANRRSPVLPLLLAAVVTGGCLAAIGSSPSTKALLALPFLLAVIAGFGKSGTP